MKGASPLLSPFMDNFTLDLNFLAKFFFLKKDSKRLILPYDMGMHTRAVELELESEVILGGVGFGRNVLTLTLTSI
jgi:hypothetical protein